MRSAWGGRMGCGTGTLVMAHLVSGPQGYVSFIFSFDSVISKYYLNVSRLTWRSALIRLTYHLCLLLWSPVVSSRQVTSLLGPVLPQLSDYEFRKESL